MNLVKLFYSKISNQNYQLSKIIFNIKNINIGDFYLRTFQLINFSLNLQQVMQY